MRRYLAAGLGYSRTQSCAGICLLVILESSLVFCQQPVAPAPNGKEIFVQRCAECHGDHGQGISAAMTILGPNIQAELNPGSVMTAMEVGPSHMPQFQYILSIQEMQSVADYVAHDLAVIPLGGGDLGQGGKLFREYCAPCHRTAVRGGALAYTGTNAPDLTSKSDALIAGAIRWGPGAMPSFPSSVLDDKDVDSIVKYIKFVQHPPNPGGTPMNWFGPVAEGFIAWMSVFVLIAITGWIEKGGKG